MPKIQHKRFIRSFFIPRIVCLWFIKFVALFKMMLTMLFIIKMSIIISFMFIFPIFWFILIIVKIICFIFGMRISTVIVLTIGIWKRSILIYLRTALLLWIIFRKWYKILFNLFFWFFLFFFFFFIGLIIFWMLIFFIFLVRINIIILFFSIKVFIVLIIIILMSS